jgi:transposase-like protein
MEMEVQEHIGAAPHERSGYRNGYRDRSWETRVGTVELKVPRVRDGKLLLPSLLEPRRKAERALSAVVPGSLRPRGFSTRKVDELVKALGMSGISKRARSQGSAKSSTRRSSTFATVLWKVLIPMCGWTPATLRPARTVKWPRWPR